MKGYRLDLVLRIFGFRFKVRGTIDVYDGPPMPGPITLCLVKETDDMLFYKFNLQAPGANDVVSREFTLTIGETEPVLQQLAADVIEVSEVAVEQGVTVKASLVDVDDQGNRSPARELEFVATDTIAPPQPGEFSVELLREE